MKTTAIPVTQVVLFAVTVNVSALVSTSPFVPEAAKVPVPTPTGERLVRSGTLKVVEPSPVPNVVLRTVKSAE